MIHFKDDPKLKQSENSNIINFEQYRIYNMKNETECIHEHSHIINCHRTTFLLKTETFIHVIKTSHVIHGIPCNQNKYHRDLWQLYL